MTPAFGGPPLPAAPILFPADHAGARQYLYRIDKALDQDGWSKNQRRYLKTLRIKWAYRAQGLDANFERRGDVGGNPEAPPPTARDVVIARWRQAHLIEKQAQDRGRTAFKRIRDQEKNEDRDKER